MRAIVSTIVTTVVTGGLLIGGVADTATAAQQKHRPGPIKLSSTSIPEDAPRGTVVGRLSSTDPDKRYFHTFTLVPGKGSDDNASFKVWGNRLVVAAPLDFETDPSLSVRAQVKDMEGNVRTGRFTIAVRDVVDQPPTDILISGASVAENLPAGTPVGSLSTVGDPAGSSTYTVVGGSGFTVSGNQLRTTAPLDFEAQAVRTVRVQSATKEGVTIEKDLSVSVTDANDAPTDIRLSVDSVTELAASAPVGLLSATDQDVADTFTYALVPGAADNGLFTVSGDRLSTASALSFNHGAYSVRVRVTDAAGATYEKGFPVRVVDVNEAPYNVRLTNDSVDENEDDGFVVGRVRADDADGDTLTYELASGCHSRVAVQRRGCRTPVYPFSVAPDGKISTNRSFNFESSESWPLSVRVSDGRGGSVEQSFTIAVNDVNEKPFDLDLVLGDSIDDFDVAGTVVGQASASDVDADDELTFSLDADCARHHARCRTTNNFSITADGEVSITRQLPANTYYVRIVATDLDGLSVTDSFPVTVDAACGRHARLKRC